MSSLPRDPTAAVIVRLNRNINALGSAIEQIGLWIAAQGSIETAASIRVYLVELDQNAGLITDEIRALVAKSASDESGKTEG
ncbi:hypothetical protein ACCD02_12075 [Pseudomonas sp. Pseusp88]|uniref:hypothetical protein n=2 Tax=unclassified Pseudomonas TaxID=196821 RepID=UPI0039A51669